jgi:hypothetical protein
MAPLRVTTSFGGNSPGGGSFHRNCAQQLCHLLALDYVSRSVEAHILFVLFRVVCHRFVLIVHGNSSFGDA